MAGRYSKDKGSTFERDTCRELSLWWTAGERDDIFWRTAGSGSRATNRMKQGQPTAGAYGDMTFTDSIGEPLLHLCCFEFKRGYGNWCLLDVIDKRPMKGVCVPSTVERFWEQAVQSAEDAHAKYPVVIFRRDKRKTCILSLKMFMSDLSLYVGTYRKNRIFMHLCGYPVFVTTLCNFLGYCTPEAIRELAELW